MRRSVWIKLRALLLGSSITVLTVPANGDESAEALKASFIRFHSAKDQEGALSLFCSVDDKGEMAELYKRSMLRALQRPLVRVNVDMQLDEQPEGEYTVRPVGRLLLEYDPAQSPMRSQFFYIGMHDDHHCLTIPRG